MFDHTLSNSEARAICPMSEVQMRNMMRACGFKMQGGWYISAVKLRELMDTGIADAFRNDAAQIEPVYVEDWILLSDQPPVSNGEYFIFTDSGKVKKAAYKKARGFMTKEVVTHWLPLPKPPAPDGIRKAF